MGLVAMVSAKGAPGVTTLTVALAALTPGAVAADLDPEGGDLALRYRRADGALFDLDRGLLSLAASLRRDPNDFTAAGPIESHLQVTGGGLEMLLGVRGPDQAIGLGALWTPLARALSDSGRTIFADCGRIGPSSPVMPVLQLASAVIIVARAELVELAHLRERLRFLTTTLPARSPGQARIAVVLVAAERDRAAAPRTEQLLRSSKVAVSVLGTVADDPRGAERLYGLGTGRAGRTTLIRSVRSLLPAVQAMIRQPEPLLGQDAQFAQATKNFGRPRRIEQDPFREPGIVARQPDSVQNAGFDSPVNPYQAAEPFETDEPERLDAVADVAAAAAAQNGGD